MEDIKENRFKKLDEFADLARKKGYREETIELTAMLCYSKDMHKNYGDTLMCIEKALELCKQNDDGKIFIAKLLKYAGVE